MKEQKDEIKALRRAKHSAEAVLRGLQEHGILDSVSFDGTYTVRFGHTTLHGVA